MSTTVLFRHERPEPPRSAITAVVSLYNYADEVERALESLRHQTEADLDLVVVDDASKDGSRARALAWLERNAERFGSALLLGHGRNRGPGAARNSAISAARTEFVFFLDADDRIYPPCLERLRRALTWSKASFSYPYLAVRGDQSRLLNLEPWNPERLRHTNIVCVTALVRRESFQILGGFDPRPELQGWEDYELWVRMAQSSRTGVLVPEVLGEYWIHPGSVTGNARDRLPELVESLHCRHPRFFFPRAELTPGAPVQAGLQYAVDWIRETAEFVEIRGWALLPDSTRPAGRLSLCLEAAPEDGRGYATVIQPRPDLAAPLGPEAVGGGFVIYVPQEDLKGRTTTFHLRFDTGLRVFEARNAGVIRLNLSPRGRASAKARTERDASILMYHRVCEGGNDPFGIAIEPEVFSRQLEYLRRNHRVAPLSELLQEWAAGKFTPRTVAITFDDGYADLVHAALPRLEEAGLPATFCLAAGMIGRSREFWTDELERIVARAALRGCTLRLALAGAPPGFDPMHGKSNLPALVKLLRPLPDLIRDRLVSRLAGQVGDEAFRDTHRPLSRAELGALARSRWSEIASHSLTHAVLSSEDEDRQREEIVESRRLLEDLTGRTVTVFCYPFGQACDFTDDTVRLVREAGYQAALTTWPGVVRAGTDPFLLPRLYVRNWSPDELARRLEAPAATSAEAGPRG